MNLQNFMAVVAMILCVVPVYASESSRAGPSFREGVQMAEEPKAPVNPEPTRAQAVSKQIIFIPLKNLPDPAKTEDEFGNRSREKYQAANLEDLLESYKVRGMLDPPVVTRGKDDKWEIVAGHRRTAAQHLGVARNLPGYSLDMPVRCLEVLNATNLELLFHSIVSNELGQKLDVKERLVAAKKLHDAGATKKEIAAALGVNEKSIGRDLKIVTNERVLKHVMADNLPPTTAAALVEAAEKSKRLEEFLSYFDTWTQQMKEKLEHEDHRAKLETGKGLKPNQLLVMSKLEPHIVRGWIDALIKGKALTEESDLGFEASFDRKTAVASIKLRVDGLKDPVEHLARVASQVSLVAKHIAAIAQRRHAIESPEGPQAALQQEDTVLDTGLLKEFGLEDVAVQFEQELRGEQASPHPIGMRDVAGEGENDTGDGCEKATADAPKQ